MLGFGILALVGVGVAVSMGGGGDDAVELEQDDVLEDNLDDAPTDVTDDMIVGDDDEADVDADGDGPDADADGFGVADLGYDPFEGATAEQAAQIEAFIAELQANPSDDMIEQFEDFLDSLDDAEEPDIGDDTGTSDDEPDQVADETPVEAEETARPPMGEDFRDPLIVAEELEEQRILDEIAAEEARTPPNLVTVTDGDGEEVPDEGVLAERDESASEEDPAYTVTAPTGANSIDVTFDAEHTFAIEYNADTVSVTAGLNSTIEGPDGGLVRSITNEENEAGVNVRTLMWEKDFDNETEITIEVAEDHIGAHIAQIDLTNPNDTLHFDFDNDVSGELHLVYLDNEGGGDADSVTTKRAYIIHTGEGAGSPTASDIATLLENGGSMNDVNILAEVYLGEDTVDINGDPDDGEPYEIWITNFINDTPQISSNLDWATVTELDATQATGSGGEGGEGGSGEGGGDGEDIGGMIEGIGLNPDFFGF